MVDNDTAVCGPAAERLRDVGHRAVEANDGPTALRLLDEGLWPDVLVMDVGLPNGMDGKAPAEAGLERLLALPVLFMTGYARVPLPADAAIITKPISLEFFAMKNLSTSSQ